MKYVLALLLLLLVGCADLQTYLPSSPPPGPPYGKPDYAQHSRDASGEVQVYIYLCLTANGYKEQCVAFKYTYGYGHWRKEVFTSHGICSVYARK